MSTLPIARRRPPLAGALAVAALSCSLAACGSSAAPGARVASLPQGQATTRATGGSHRRPSADRTAAASRTASHTTVAPPASARRPVLRLDDTQQRRTALFNAYSRCLLDHGASPATSGMAPAPGGSIADAVLVQQPVPTGARAACVGVLPLSPPQLEAATNPHFHADSLAYVACLRRGGEWVRLLNGHNLNWTFVAGHTVPGDEGALENRCLLRSFGGG